MIYSYSGQSEQGEMAKRRQQQSCAELRPSSCAAYRTGTVPPVVESYSKYTLQGGTKKYEAAKAYSDDRESVDVLGDADLSLRRSVLHLANLNDK